ncbi:hypothetical protein [Paenibacillus cineris]|uniref:hypothetical protein n=1 Tax=Paenibacillus cineris TaxID=237530 RepID=UPI001B0966C6|nr:hypothetical protein [Paenibacillus cineris]GIO59394.1 hypothetical protein J43TS9_09680 [Paenibacillus cineris]
MYHIAIDRQPAAYDFNRRYFFSSILRFLKCQLKFMPIIDIAYIWLQSMIRAAGVQYTEMGEGVEIVDAAADWFVESGDQRDLQVSGK